MPSRRQTNMPSTTTLRCPACGKVNSSLPDHPAHTAGTSPCTRCQADLRPLLHIRQVGLQLQGQLLRQLGASQREQARATLREWQALSPQATQFARQLQSLLS